MKRTTPFQCFHKPTPEAAAASGDTLQTDDRNVNIKETTENEPELIQLIQMADTPYMVQKTRPMLS